MYAPCARGLESILADELRRLRVPGVRPQRGGVLFAGTITDAYRVLLWSRFASRVLLSLGEVEARDADSLYAGVAAIAWEDHVRADGTIAVDAAGVNEKLRNTQFTAVRVKDAIADRFLARFGRRPSVDTAQPELRVNVVVRGERAKIAIDLSGQPLHRRGYREAGVQVAAPMKETLAAAVIEFAGWREIAAAGGAFCDPMCGSGTLAIEAALVAGDVAPGLLRREWGFDRWLGHDAGAWERLRADAAERRSAGVAAMVQVAGSDSDPHAIEIARRFVRRAGLEAVIRLDIRSLVNAQPPGDAPTGLVACNPPYGQRIDDRRGLPVLYGELGQLMREGFTGWHLAPITSDEGVGGGLDMKPASTHDVMNGRIPAKVWVFPDAGAPAAPDPSAEAFENRLRKMAKHLSTWARRTGVSCYRVYDADLPDYNVAVDIYGGAGPDEGKRWVHIAEYAPPADVDAAKAAERLARATTVAGRVLEIEPGDIFVKRRERQRGSAQYERAARDRAVGIVEENGLLFEVNLSDYLDTGLFLDHRDTRAWVREMAEGTRFLNLFAYTGTASVYAAAGGARSTTTVDLSPTYLEWSERNLARNGFTGTMHAAVRTDVMAWLADPASADEEYDLVFCDPPTFSNSKRMEETFDVQRDHVRLITSAASLLSENGTLLFSCNRKRFEIDEPELVAAGLSVRDVTRRTIPKDFERTPGVHHCWLVARASDSEQRHAAASGDGVPE